MLYAAKCYWPGITQTELERVAARVLQHGTAPDPDGVAYVGSLLFARDQLVLCLFEASSPAAVSRASERAGIPSEHLRDVVWLGPPATSVNPRAKETPCPRSSSPADQ